MANKSNTGGHGSNNEPAAKVGSDANAARKVGGSGDFGVRADDRIRREYASQDIKQQDKGGGVTHSSDNGDIDQRGQGLRESGVGGNASGPGSSSGGDIDTDFVGVIGGISQSGPDDRKDGPDMVGGTNRDERPRTKSSNHAGSLVGKVGGSKQISGTTNDRSGGDASTGQDGQGAGAVTNAGRNDDAFAGEVTDDEASGENDET